MKSLVNQTLRNIQIICINDESPDNSINIIKKYVQQDKRIILKNIKHASISETRNEGLKYVEGEYIGFIDDDDFIDLYQYEKMYEYAKKDEVDLLEFGYQKIGENKRLKNLKHKIHYKDEKTIDKIDGNVFKNLQNHVWDKIYRTEIVKKKKVKFIPNLGGEDLNFNLKFYPFVKKFKKIYSKTYFYRIKKKLLYIPKIYFFKNNNIFFSSLVEYYKKNKINKSNPKFCLELMIISYKKLFWKKYYYKREYLNNFFLSLKKLNIKNEIIQKISIELKNFYFDIKNKYKKFNFKIKNDL